MTPIKILLGDTCHQIETFWFSSCCNLGIYKINFLPVYLYLVLFHSSTVILPERLVNFPKLTGAASAPRLSGTDEPEIAEMRIPILILANLVFSNMMRKIAQIFKYSMSNDYV